MLRTMGFRRRRMDAVRICTEERPRWAYKGELAGTGGGRELVWSKGVGDGGKCLRCLGCVGCCCESQRGD
jgi:hypothetical protein